MKLSVITNALKTHKKIKSILLISASIFNIYVLANLFLMLFLWNKYNSASINDLEKNTDSFVADSASIFVSNHSGQYKHRTSFNTFNYTINNIGSRNDFNVSIAGMKNREVSVLLGDSFVFGYGLNDNETLSYYLDLIEPDICHVNLGLPGFNLSNSIERFMNKRKYIPDPLYVVIGYLYNDIYDSYRIEYQIRSDIDKWAKYIGFPFNKMLTKDKLCLRYLSVIERKALAFEDNEYRYVRYIEAPLTKLVNTLRDKKTKIILVVYDEDSDFFINKIKRFCRDNDIRIIISGDQAYCRYRLIDNHPGGEFNKLLASHIASTIKLFEEKDVTELH